MFALRHHIKPLLALPVAGFVTATIIFFASSAPAARPAAIGVGLPALGGLLGKVGDLPLGNKPAPEKDTADMTYPEKVAHEKSLGISMSGPDALIWDFFRKYDRHCRKPAVISIALSKAAADPLMRTTRTGKAVSMVEVTQEQVWRARGAGLLAHGFFLTSDGKVPTALAPLENIEVSGGVGMITQTPAGMTFPPDRAASAQYWLAAMRDAGETPDPQGMFGVVLEPPPGGCK